ncbi:MAG: BON domain-containing protein [Pedobacter sp.]|nr:MAG: BON domain-containing protein [Pedobacter sp.]
MQAKERAGNTVVVAKDDVTLTDEVADEVEKAKAEEIARAEKGVKSVINSLMIKTVAPVIIAQDTDLIKNVADAIRISLP